MSMDRYKGLPVSARSLGLLKYLARLLLATLSLTLSGWLAHFIEIISLFKYSNFWSHGSLGAQFLSILLASYTRILIWLLWLMADLAFTTSNEAIGFLLWQKTILPFSTFISVSTVCPTKLVLVRIQKKNRVQENVRVEESSTITLTWTLFLRALQYCHIF